MEYNEFFQKAKEKKIEEIQVTEKQALDSSVELINGKLESFEDYSNTDFNIKASYKGKNVKTSTNYLEEDILDLILLKCEATDSVYEDDYLEAKKPTKQKPMKDFEISKEIKELKKLDSLREKYPQISKLTFYFSENSTKTRIVNSKKVDISTTSHLCSFVAEVIIEKGGKFTSFDRQILTTDKKEIDFENFTIDVIEKAILQSERETLETNKYDILLDSYAAGRIISHLGNMLSGTSIRNKVSCLEKELEKKVFNQKITIIEDPTNDAFPGYRLFDDEGTETKKKYIVKEGKIKTFLYNIKEAKMKNTDSTGNGYQGIGTKNMYVVPGDRTDKELLQQLKDGIYIVDYMGASGTSINSVNGSISLQVFGFLVKDGQIVSGIEPSIMTTTIFELLSNVEEISSELKFTTTSAASPSLLIKGISIAR